MALAAFTACDDAPEAATPQKNPQPVIFQNADVQAALAAPLAQASAPGALPLNLQDYRDENLVTLMDNISVTNIPAGAEVVFELELSNSASFPAEATIPLTATTNADGTATILTSDWNQAHYDLEGKSMTPKQMYYRVYGYISLDNTRYLIGEADPANPSNVLPKSYGAGEFAEVPFELIIDSAYYLLSDATTWTFADAAPYKFSHGGDDVYANPVFTFEVEFADASEAKGYWKIASQKAIDAADWALVYGPSINGDKSMTGKLFINGQAGHITEPGTYTFSINMEDMTYTITKKTRPDYVVVASNASGWSATDGKSRLLYGEKDGVALFRGASVANNNDGGFKFVWDETWHGVDFSTAPDAANIKAPVDETRLYWFTVDTEVPSYTIKEVTSLGLIGLGGKWDPETDVVEMTPSEDYLTWTVDANLSGEWKIMINNTWDSNYGSGEGNTVVFNAGNISGYDGPHTVTLSFAGNTPTLKVEPRQ